MIGFLLAACALLAFSSTAIGAAADAAAVFAAGVLPALFPMMVLNNLSAALPEKRPPSPGRARLIAVAFAFLAGSPASAQRLEGLHGRYGLSPGALYGLAGATGVMSPLFITGALGRGLDAPQGAWLLLAAHWGGALLTGAIAGAAVKRLEGRDGAGKDFGSVPRTESRVGSFAASHAGSLVDSRTDSHASPSAGTYADPPAIAPADPPKQPPPSLAAALPGAVTGAAQALLSVCGAMMLFSILAAVGKALLSRLFPLWTAANGPLLAVLWAVLEIGGGAFAVLDAFPALPLPLLCALCGFGGLSIWLQNLLFLGKTMRPAGLLLLRGLHGALSYLLCSLALRLFPALGAAAALGDGAGRLPPVSPAFPPYLPALALLCLLALPRPGKARP